MEQDYGIERRLAGLSPELHGRYRDCVVISQRMLCRYENYFPDFTDHTVLHTLDILELCNQLIGGQLEKLNAQELYVLLMGALFHDVGMGVSVPDFEQFRKVPGGPGAGGRHRPGLGRAGPPPGAVGAVSWQVRAPLYRLSRH